MYTAKLSLQGKSHPCWSLDQPLLTAWESDMVEGMRHIGKCYATRTKYPGLRVLLSEFAFICFPQCLLLPGVGKNLLTLQSRSCERKANGPTLASQGFRPSLYLQPSWCQQGIPLGQFSRSPGELFGDLAWGKVEMGYSPSSWPTFHPTVHIGCTWGRWGYTQTTRPKSLTASSFKFAFLSQENLAELQRQWQDEVQFYLQSDSFHKT